MTSRKTKERDEQEQTERLQKGGNVDSDPEPNAETTNKESDLKAANLNDTDRNDRNNADMDVAGDATTTVGTGEKCPACNGTGAVVSELKDGRVEKWKNCPMCGAKGINPVRRNLNPEDCEECNGTGKVPENFIDGKVTSTKSCVRCKGTGRKNFSDNKTAVNTADNVPDSEKSEDKNDE